MSAVATDTELIEESWDELAGHHGELIDDFYDRLFQRYPQYKPLFEGRDMERQREKMVQNIALMAKLANDPNAIRPHLRRVGEAHRHLSLEPQDLGNFADLLIEVIGDYCQRYGKTWSDSCRQAWEKAFHQIMLPDLEQALDS